MKNEVIEDMRTLIKKMAGWMPGVSMIGKIKIPNCE